MKIYWNEQRAWKRTTICKKTIFVFRRIGGWGQWRGEGGKHKRQKSGAFPFGLIASATGPLIGEVAKPILKKIFGRG